MSLVRNGGPALRTDFDRVFDAWFGSRLPTRPSGDVPVWAPAINIREDNENFYVEAELPGLQRQDIDVELEHNELRLRGERKFEQREDKENYHCVERSYGSFFRSIELPTPVKAEAIQAEYKDGLLLVTLPKTNEARARKVKVG